MTYPRCHREHPDLRSIPFRRPREGYTHWAVCPDCDGVILLKEDPCKRPS